MIIGLSGRIKSGKTELANELVKELGFEIFSFADYLRKLLIDIYKVDSKYFYSQDLKKTQLSKPLKWNKKIADQMSEYTQTKLICEEPKEILCVRDAMQFIGTDILRKADIDFHVKKTLNSLDLSKNLVCDDVRFPNELRGLEKIGANCCFILRPNNFDILNHKSETSLKWNDFDIHIINDKPLDKLKKDFLLWVKYIGYTPHKNAQHTVLDKQTLVSALEKNRFNTTQAAKQLECSPDKIRWWAKRFGVELPLRKHPHNKTAFLFADETSAYLAGVLSADGCVKRSGNSRYRYCLELSMADIEPVQKLKQYCNSTKSIYTRLRGQYKPLYSFMLECPFVIENLKFWNLKPRKSGHNEIPDIIRNDDKLLGYWLVGLIDGDGSVFLQNKKDPTIIVLASKEIVDFLSEKFSHLNPHIYKHKKSDNLYELRFFNKYAVELCKQICAIDNGLHRKWDTIKRHLLLDC